MRGVSVRGINKRAGDAKRRPFLAFVSNYCTPEGMVPARADRAAQGRSGPIPGLPGSAPATLGAFNRYTSTRSLACDLFDGSMWRVNNYLTGCTRRAREAEAELYRGYWRDEKREGGAGVPCSFARNCEAAAPRREFAGILSSCKFIV